MEQIFVVYSAYYSIVYSVYYGYHTENWTLWISPVGSGRSHSMGSSSHSATEWLSHWGMWGPLCAAVKLTLPLITMSIDTSSKVWIVKPTPAGGGITMIINYVWPGHWLWHAEVAAICMEMKMISKFFQSWHKTSVKNLDLNWSCHQLSTTFMKELLHPILEMQGISEVAESTTKKSNCCIEKWWSYQPNIIIQIRPFSFHWNTRKIKKEEQGRVVALKSDDAIKKSSCLLAPRCGLSICNQFLFIQPMKCKDFYPHDFFWQKIWTTGNKE